jgi:hypothetical protein
MQTTKLEKIRLSNAKEYLKLLKGLFGKKALLNILKRLKPHIFSV